MASRKLKQSGFTLDRTSGGRRNHWDPRLNAVAFVGARQASRPCSNLSQQLAANRPRARDAHDGWASVSENTWRARSAGRVCVRQTVRRAHQGNESARAFRYIDPYSQVFHCPEDKGLDFREDGPYYGPSCHYAFGCSYRLNTAPWENTRYEVEGVLPGHKSGWVRKPSEYIYVYEPPAGRCTNHCSIRTSAS